ncbi:MAG: Co2+/Mg2+ efflux protein ApaG [Rickettsiales bacterium]
MRAPIASYYKEDYIARMFTKTTRHIKVTASPNFLAEHSEPTDSHYVWSYTIQLENYGDTQVQLMNRHWVITDAQGLTQEVRGEGVIGKRPVLKPGETFRYTSGTALAAPSGVMLGEYEMLTPDGERFEVEVPAFSLDSPFQMGRPN